MKKILIVLTMAISSICTAQMPRLELTKNGVTPIVIDAPGMSASDIYTKAKGWIQKNYAQPKEVLSADIANEHLRIDGFDRDAWSMKSFGIESKYDMYHSIVIDVKDGEYRLTYLVGEFWSGPNKALFGWKSFFKNDGSVRKSHLSAKESVESRMNATSESLHKYIVGQSDNVW